MVDIDWRGIAFGVSLGILGQAIYDAFFYLISGQPIEELRAGIAGLITVSVLLLLFYQMGYLKEKETKKITETK